MIHKACATRAHSCCTLAVGVATLLAAESTSRAQTYVCPPPPEGVYGLPGGPKFAESPLPDSFASQVDDPRWNGSWRNDFATGSSTEAGVRMLKEGTNLFVSFEAKVDPDGASGAGSADEVFLGFSADGMTAQVVKLTMTASPPQTNSTSIQAATTWKTTNGGTSWVQQLPVAWAGTSNVHLWSGTGAGNGDAWAFNAKLDLTAIGTALGAPVTGSFYMWYEIDIDGPSATVQYSWPAGVVVTADGNGPLSLSQPITNTTTHAISWGNAYPTVATNCPVGIALDPMAIGLTPVTSGIPSTVAHYGTGHPPNDWVAELTPPAGSTTIPDGSVKARFRIANWGSTIGVGGDWKDMLPSPSPGVPGTQTNVGSQIDWHCVNPPDVSAPQCYQLPSGAPTDQCLLVELSQANGSGIQFLNDSARRNMDFVNASTFERLAEVSIRGLAPLPGSGGTRDVYLYVRSLNMPETANGNPPIQIPPPVPTVPPQQDAGVPVIGRGVQDAGAPKGGQQGPALDAGRGQEGPPRYRMSTYERYASVMPTYEVHVYHDTGRTRTEEGRTLKVLEPQAPFGYFVTHQGDLAGWTHELTGEGFVLEQIAPNFYRAHVPDNGLVKLRTKIVAREPGHVHGHRCLCDVVGSDDGSPLAAAAAGLGAAAFLARRRRRARS